jgi:hypothetical protein
MGFSLLKAFRIIKDQFVSLFVVMPACSNVNRLKEMRTM